MNSQFSELEAKLLEFYALPEEGRLREKTLSLACELTGQPASSAALLYLYDPAKECFHLDHHHPDA
ncbi:MAG: hypothetical protein NT069_10125, partial [Planctomycetota bacterium]|nr:hypothetical protein [Planctomycetota bacterium]